MNLILVFLALQVADAPSSPELTAARDYARCIGLTAVVGSANIPSIDEAIRRAFEQCGPKRATALAAIADAFRAGGLDEAQASREAEDTLRENDLTMANKLKADIAAFRQTGRTPSDASNH
jgi:hypothetical protein